MFLYLTDKDHRLIEFMKEGSSRFNIWNEILERDLIKFYNLPFLKFIKVETTNLLEKVELRLKILIEENNLHPKDYPNWQGRFYENDVFTEMDLFGEKHFFCNTGRENTIIFLGNVFYFLQKERDNQLYEILGSNHSEINLLLNKNGSS